MRVLYLDIDTLRPDHLGCYGYHRNTSPNVDRIAGEGVRFTNYYASDAPCLPSRSALFNGRFGIHTGVVNHGGEAADMFLEGKDRQFWAREDRMTWTQKMREAGFYTVSISPFAERHAAWWFYQGFLEIHNTGRRGNESAEEIMPTAINWLEQNGQSDNWFLQLNLWDPHTPYRAPAEFGNPFQNDPPPSFMTEERRKKQFESYGPHSAQEGTGYGIRDEDWQEFHRTFPRVPRNISSMDDYKQWIDGYDCGIRYMDDQVGKVLDILEKQGVLDETVIILSSDHGENQGELNIYGDHHTADHITSRVPLIIRWPGVTPAGTSCEALLYNLDLPPTMLEFVGGTAPALWDGESFAPAVRGEEFAGRDHLVVSQCAWSCQRSVRWKNWMMIRTYHDGLKDFAPVMLFDVENDPHELNDLAQAKPEVVNEGLAILERWTAEMMTSSEHAEDPMWIVMSEGGPYHTAGAVMRYAEHLRNTGRAHHAEAIVKRHGKLFERWKR